MSAAHTAGRLVGLLTLLAGLVAAWWPATPRRDEIRVPIAPEAVRAERGLAYVAPIDVPVESDKTRGWSPLVLLEDGRPLTPHAGHARIRAEGGGLYSHWGDWLYFSASDGSDPRTNGRQYVALVPGGYGRRGALAYALPVLLAFAGAVLLARRAPQADAPPRRPRLAALAAASLLAALFVVGAVRHGELLNTDVHAWDQSAYLNYAEGLAAGGDEYYGDRNRMPAFPWLLSLGYAPEESVAEWFGEAQRFSLYLTLLVLLGAFGVFALHAPLTRAALLTLIAAFTVFVFKATYVRAEVSYYFAALVAFALACRQLARPSWPLAVATGAWFGVTYLTKASAMPGIQLFLVVAAGQSLLAGRGRRLIGLARTVLVALCFLVVVFPYVAESKRIYGRWFYNVNTTFYVWYDSWQEVLDGVHAHGDRDGWPDMPAEEIPSASRYWREHGLVGCVDRVREGMGRLWDVARNSYGYLPFALIFAALPLAHALVQRRRAAEALRAHGAVVVYALAFFALYLVGYAWYTRISSPNRFVLSLLLPLLLASAVACRALGSGRTALVLRGRPVSVGGLVDLAVLGLLVQEVWVIYAERLETLPGGG